MEGWREMRVYKTYTKRIVRSSRFISKPWTNYVWRPFSQASFCLYAFHLASYDAGPSLPGDNPSAPPKHYRITVKRSLAASLWLHELAYEGPLLEVQCPAGDFILDWRPQYPPRQIYISAGIDVTALVPMIRAHFLHLTFWRTPAIWIRVVPDGTSATLLSSDIPQNEFLKEYLECITFFTQPRPLVDV